MEHSVGEDGDIFGGGEKASVSGDAAEDVGVFILNFALDDSVTERTAGFSGFHTAVAALLAGGGARPAFFSLSSSCSSAVGGILSVLLLEG